MDAIDKNCPPITLVISVRNEEASIDGLLASIRAQTHQPAEIIFVDGGSQDRTVQLIRKTAGNTPPWRVIEAGPATPGRGRNTGIVAATTEWVALTDAGIHLEPTWLEELVAIGKGPPETDIVYGNYEPIIETFFEQNAALVYVPPKQERSGGKMRGPSIASCLLRRKVWQQIGGFPDLRASEDLIFMERVEQQGFAIGWAPRATVWWQLRPTLATTFRRFVLYSKHNVLAGRQMYWHYGIARQYGFALIFILIAIVTRSWWWLLALPLGLLVRALKTFWRQRHGQALLGVLNPARLAHVLLLILSIDLATFVGWAQAFWERRSAIAVRASADRGGS